MPLLASVTLDPARGPQKEKDLGRFPLFFSPQVLACVLSGDTGSGPSSVEARGVASSGTCCIYQAPFLRWRLPGDFHGLGSP